MTLDDLRRFTLAALDRIVVDQPTEFECDVPTSTSRLAIDCEWGSWSLVALKPTNVEAPRIEAKTSR
jgi:hypothetical protein